LESQSEAFVTAAESFENIKERLLLLEKRVAALEAHG
jgi:hypothetical protein